MSDRLKIIGFHSQDSKPPSFDVLTLGSCSWDESPSLFIPCFKLSKGWTSRVGDDLLIGYSQPVRISTRSLAPPIATIFPWQRAAQGHGRMHNGSEGITELKGNVKTKKQEGHQRKYLEVSHGQGEQYQRQIPCLRDQRWCIVVVVVCNVGDPYMPPKGWDILGMSLVCTKRSAHGVGWTSSATCIDKMLTTGKSSAGPAVW